jgi:hypothetical protein
VAGPSVSRRSARCAVVCIALAWAGAVATAAPAQAGGAPTQAAGAASAPDDRAPPAGRYEATLCVANAAQAPSCGPAEAEVRGGGAVDVRVSDIVYRLARSGSTSIVVVTQGQMMIDAFDAGPQWAGRSLRFIDTEKQVRYELELGAARRPRR